MVDILIDDMIIGIFVQKPSYLSSSMSKAFNFRFMMYGFGDDPCPYTQSIALIEDIVLNYINEISLRYII